ncbi:MULTISPECIES: transglutaminase family protein [unclassified Acidovorax]|uniref:transglutaminase family protein n=1 Tax=unclassified Acidovorax TaxID=2684926 RepID=UPI0006FC99B1|nr:MULTISPECIES: transglutaminase family protein [unclassified Acidovorax]KRB42184.1 transglutaminase [Acidovorax sp. Root70]PUA95619.1 transglutaminase-like putative cysteine protease [Acidovorax sp. 107]
MRLRVVHETLYRYNPAVQNAQHMAHLRPRTGPVQRVLTHALQIDPAPAQCETTQDVFGNTRAFFSLPFTHEQLRVRAETLLDTTPPPPAPPGEPWEAVRERLGYRRGQPYQDATEFSFASPYIPRHADFVAYAAASFAPGRPLMQASSHLMSRIHADFAYTAHATDAGTPALESLRLRRGVCQDFAHVMIGCLRSLGLAARYVSGYLLTEPPPGQPRLVGADASHAWVSVWSPPPADGGDRPGHEEWFDLDPTNDRPAGEDYVTLAIGRDFSDVSPLRGVIHGGDHHVLQVGVTVEPLHREPHPVAGSEQPG